jgi:protein-S-isoprenylcysteine O-methyltransferase Ste14
MRVVDVVIPAGWVAFWIYWLAAASRVKEGRTQWTRFAGIRVAIILIILLLLRSNALGHTNPTSNPWLQGVGVAVFLLGLAVAIWARVYLGRNWGMPMTEKVDPDLVTTARTAVSVTRSTPGSSWR